MNSPTFLEMYYYIIAELNSHTEYLSVLQKKIFLFIYILSWNKGDLCETFIGFLLGAIQMIAKALMCIHCCWLNVVKIVIT